MKTKIDNIPLIAVMPTLIVSTEVDGQVNYSAVGQCGQVNYSPPVISISVAKKGKTAANILAARRFGANIPDSTMLGAVISVSRASGNDVDKSNLFEIFRSGENIPLIKDSPVNMACEVIEQLEIGENIVFFGAIKETYVNDDILDGKNILTEKINPLLCSLDGQFWSIKEGKIEIK